jgi:hypothetical protein
MKEKPILFSTPMVQSILIDEKTQTRRTINHFGNSFHYEMLLCDWGLSGIPFLVENNIWEWTLQTEVDDNVTFKFKCPYGQMGDILWVRETFRIINHSGTASKYFYKADACETDLNDKKIKWKPSIFMPKEACRIKLKIIDIRVERIQDISEKDSKSEGVLLHERGKHWLNYIDQSYKMTQFIYNLYSAKESYKSLWTLINGRDSWNNNPWVWVIEFKRI